MAKKTATKKTKPSKADKADPTIAVPITNAPAAPESVPSEEDLVPKR